jgi:hypothetical protein
VKGEAHTAEGGDERFDALGTNVVINIIAEDCMVVEVDYYLVIIMIVLYSINVKLWLWVLSNCMVPC